MMRPLVLLAMATSALAQPGWTEECHSFTAPAVPGMALTYAWGEYKGTKGVMFKLGFQSADAVDWAAIGLRAKGGAASMDGFDIIAVDSKKSTVPAVDGAFDGKATGNSKPVADGAQDATLILHAEQSGHTDVEFFRPLTTSDDIALMQGDEYELATATGEGSPWGTWNKHTMKARNAFPTKSCTAPPPANLPVTATPLGPINTQYLPKTNKPPPTAPPPAGATPPPVVPGNPPPPPPAGGNPVAQPPPAAPKEDDSSDTGLIVGLVIGALLLCGLAVLALLFVSRRNGQQQTASFKGTPNSSGQYAEEGYWDQQQGGYGYDQSGSGGDGQYNQMSWNNPQSDAPFKGGPANQNNWW